jgi:hypothetical protein
MPIVSEKRSVKMMNYTDFKAQMLELCDKNAQNHPSLNELIYFFEKYDVTYKLINSKNMAYTMRNFASFDTGRRLRYRRELAETGVELTPCQVNYYINMITIILRDKYDIDT